MISGKFRLYWHGQFMFASVQHKNSMYLDRERPLWRDFPFCPVRSKDDILILRTFENFLVHFLIARIVSAITAGRENDDLATNFPVSRVKMQRPILKGERAVNSVERCAKRPVHFALCWIDAENDFIFGRRGRSVLRQGAEHQHCRGCRYQEIADRFQPDSRESHVRSCSLRGQKLPAHA